MLRFEPMLWKRNRGASHLHAVNGAMQWWRKFLATHYEGPDLITG
jgi:hypothetical protein